MKNGLYLECMAYCVHQIHKHVGMAKCDKKAKRDGVNGVNLIYINKFAKIFGMALCGKRHYRIIQNKVTKRRNKH